MKKIISFFAFSQVFLIFTLVTSCTAPTYLKAPPIDYPYVKNTYSFGVQNMDKESIVEENNLTCHYENFDIRYLVTKDYIVTLEITNKSEKSMIIDKSKCYVLYDGYATELFKDVRSSRSTTFNNVQDAINNVQTNEAGVSMTIPPYSKWTISLKETNLKKLEKLPKFVEEPGVINLTQYDDIDITEFVIPYSFDYSMAKWSTCRNRIFLNRIDVERTTIEGHYSSIYPNDGYTSFDTKGRFFYTYKADYTVPIDFSNANRIDDINIGMYKKHRNKVILTQVCCSPITIPLLTAEFIVLFPFMIFVDDPSEMFFQFGCHHYPTIYGNKYVQKERGKVKIRKDYSGD